MLITGIVEVPKEATQGGSTIDAFQLDAFRRNDVVIEKHLQALLSLPMAPNGFDKVKTNPPAHQFLAAKEITVDVQIDLVQRVPLIWFAQDRIQILAGGSINAKGKGADGNKNGDFGGSGGGGTAAGKPCQVPLSGHEIIAGGGAGANGQDLPEEWATRALANLSLCTGGAPGGDAGGGNPGGSGGGIVFLCAPIIEFQGIGIKIDASGADGLNNAGGGGGGLVVLIAGHMPGVDTDSGIGSGQNVLVEKGLRRTGGAGSGAAANGSGGQGVILKRIYL